MKKSTLFLGAVAMLSVHAESVQLMTFNYQKSVTEFHQFFTDKREKNGQRRAIAKNLLQLYQPDVVGVQEPHLGDLCFIENALGSYQWVGERIPELSVKQFFLSGGLSGGDYNAIFYNTEKFDLIDEDTFWLNENREPRKPSRWSASSRRHYHVRACTWVHLKSKETQKSLWVFNTHLSLDAPVSLQEGKLIAKVIEEVVPEGEHVVFMGDLNITPSSFLYSYLTKDRSFTDSKLVAQEVVQETPGTVGDDRRFIIDYIFLKNHAESIVERYEIVNYNEDGNYPSDHSPVIAVIDL